MGAQRAERDSLASSRRARVTILRLASFSVWATRPDRPPNEVRSMRATERQDEKATIAKVIHDSIMWALTKDVAMQQDTMAHDEDLFIIWTGSTHITSGWKEHEESFETWLDPRFAAVRTEVRNVQVHLSRSGDVAWYSADLDDVVSWEGKASKFGEGLRWTGVLEKRDGRWVIVQMHASLPVDKVRDIVMNDLEPNA
jgi:hypothetical protein